MLFRNGWDLSDGLTSIGGQLTAMGEAANKVLAQKGYGNPAKKGERHETDRTIDVGT